MLLDCHPSLEIGTINTFKTISTHLNKYLWKSGLWTCAYYIASVDGAPLDVVKKYIENQGQS